jgi:ABC-type lipoprotein release transport system permease subunit
MFQIGLNFSSTQGKLWNEKQCKEVWGACKGEPLQAIETQINVTTIIVVIICNMMTCIFILVMVGCVIQHTQDILHVQQND